MLSLDTKNLISVSVFLLSFSLEVNGGICQGENGANIIFVNGVLTSETQAQKSLNQIKEMNLDENFLGSKGGEISYQISHNQSDGLLDLYEAAGQQLGLNAADVLKYFVNFPALTEDQRNALNEIYIDTYINHLFTQKDMSGLINKINLSLSADKKTYLIGHSQGNFYINIAHSVVMANPENEDKKDMIGIIQVATPTESIGGPLISETIGRYRTYEDDRVIGSARLRGIHILPSNISSLGSIFRIPFIDFRDSFWNHGFVETYTSERSILGPVRSSVIEAIMQVAEEVNQKVCANAIGCVTEDFPDGVVGSIHINIDDTEGGFVSSDSSVSTNAYLSSQSQVCFGAKIFGNPRILGNVMIRDSETRISGAPLIVSTGGQILINSGASVADHARMAGNVGLGLGAKIFGNGALVDSAVAIGNVEISEDAEIGGNSFLISFGDPQEKVEVKGNVKVSGSYIIGQNAKLSGDFIFSGGPSAVTGHGVTIMGAGVVTNTNFSDNVEVNTTNLVAEGSGGPNGSILVFGDSKIFGQSNILGQVFIFENSTIDGFAHIKDNSFIIGDAIIRGDTVVSGSSNIGANCVLETGLFDNVGIPNLNNPSDPNNQFCPGYYIPDPMGPVSTSQLRENFVQEILPLDVNQVRDEAYLANQNMIKEAYKIRDAYLNGKFRAPASQE